ncbi:putative 9-cis-epoxycarotenoid dioxygenase [Rosa chinensis]|uniref:Putative 9-cis-epoxycarotenoid dioxygenase n=1 Tax=Rosa chinensis TaxID=74649 RepID=A0A2P6Q004_ROSCH|nr:putative 9-cis-epoxycarotenoid dioxygenase [Rosa chinensis]
MIVCLQKNFLPIEEIGELVEVTCTLGEIPADFAEGSNPLFGGLKSAVSIFGESHNIWVEGEGMLHALYFKKDDDCGSWIISYKNRYVESETFKIETQRNKPGFLPALAGDAPAIIAAFLLNSLRFGTVIKHMSNTNVFEHSGKIYSIAENYLPQEVDISTLETICDWDVNGTWDRPFTSHPKYEKEEYARIGVMPRYGDAESVKWFEVGYLFTHLYEWRLNMLSGKVEERNLTGSEYSMDFPFINEQFTGLKHKYGYTQVIDSGASSICGIEEDDGWIITFVHNEETDVTQVHIIDAQDFEGEAIAKLTLPQRVPYGFHSTFLSMPACQS